MSDDRPTLKQLARIRRQTMRALETLQEILDELAVRLHLPDALTPWEEANAHMMLAHSAFLSHHARAKLRFLGAYVDLLSAEIIRCPSVSGTP